MYPKTSISLTFVLPDSVLGAQGALSESINVVYDEKRIDERSQVIELPSTREPSTTQRKRYHYLPMAGRAGTRISFRELGKIIKDYNLKDLSI